MFSRASASSLRDSIAAGAPDRELADTYRSHYGLEFGSPERPVRHDFRAFNSDGFTIVMQHYGLRAGMQRGTAFLLHGYFDHAGLYGKLIDHCLQQGFSVVIPDLPGHGLSSGTEASIDCFSRYCRMFVQCLQICADDCHQPWICIGQSTGAAILMDSLLNHELGERFQFSQLIALAPLLRTAGWWRAKLSFSLMRWFLPRVKRNFSLNSHDDVFLEFLQYHDALQAAAIPRPWIAAMMKYEQRFRCAPQSPQALNIIQGTGDETVNWKYNLREIQEKFPHSRGYLVADARHHLVNESVEYRDRVFSLIDEITQ